MIAIPPIDCTASGVLVSTNATNLAAYAAGTTYAADATISYAKRNWISVQAGNIGHTPGTDTLWWVDNGPINTLAMFDTSVQTATIREGGLTFILAPGRVTAIGFMDLVGQTITIIITVGATTIFAETRTLARSDGTYYGFVFEEPLQTREVAFYGLPSSPTARITVAITGAGTTACGLCVVGKQFAVGNAQYGFSVPIEDRGRHYLDSLSNAVNVERGYSKGSSGTIVTDRQNLNRMIGFFSDQIGVPLLWIAAPGQNDLVSATVFGRFVRAVPVISSFDEVTIALEIAGYR
ncbi:MAG: hypothetical protein JZU64_15450 [Rhodoferax sp.]|nr:hypothetical protein [Rhodoferax sp.]